jgi:hypothetical protein
MSGDSQPFGVWRTLRSASTPALQALRASLARDCQTNSTAVFDAAAN